MAFGFIAAAHYDNTGSTSAVVSKPTGTTDNDLMVAIIKHNVGTLEEPTSVPSGWTERVHRNFDGVCDFLVYTKIAASEGTSYQWDFTSSGRLGASIATYRDGFDTADLIDVISDTLYQVENTTVRAASVSAAAANSPIIFAGLVNVASADVWSAPSVPAAMTEDVDYHNGDSRFGRTFASLLWTGSGATGNMDATVTSSQSLTKHGVALVLTPAGGAPATVKKLKLLVSSAAASATGVEGVVFYKPATGKLTGDKVGEFSGAAFDSTLTAGQAKLRVACSDFAGSSLGITASPVAIVRNATYSTSILTGNIYEETAT